MSRYSSKTHHAQHPNLHPSLPSPIPTNLAVLNLLHLSPNRLDAHAVVLTRVDFYIKSVSKILLNCAGVGDGIRGENDGPAGAASAKAASERRVAMRAEVFIFAG